MTHLKKTIYLWQCHSYYIWATMQSLPIGPIDPKMCVATFYKNVTNLISNDDAYWNLSLFFFFSLIEDLENAFEFARMGVEFSQCKNSWLRWNRAHPVLQAHKICILLLFGSYTLRCFELILRTFKMCTSSGMQTYTFLHVDLYLCQWNTREQCNKPYTFLIGYSNSAWSPRKKTLSRT